MEVSTIYINACAVCGKHPALVGVDRNCLRCASWARRFLIIKEIEK